MISLRVQFLLPIADNEKIPGIQNHVFLTLIFFSSHSIIIPLQASKNY